MKKLTNWDRMKKKLKKDMLERWKSNCIAPKISWYCTWTIYNVRVCVSIAMVNFFRACRLQINSIVLIIYCYLFRWTKQTIKTNIPFMYLKSCIINAIYRFYTSLISIWALSSHCPFLFLLSFSLCLWPSIGIFYVYF